jgi:hypothetical protein
MDGILEVTIAKSVFPPKVMKADRRYIVHFSYNSYIRDSLSCTVLQGH